MKKIVYVIALLSLCFNTYSQLSQDEFSVIISDTEISLGDRSEDVIEILGEVDYELYDNSYIVLREYSYPWGKMYTSNADDSLVFGITAESEVVKTKKGITIGHKKKNVLDMYGEPHRDIGNLNLLYYINYDFDVLELRFNFDENDEVCSLSIFLGT